MTSVIYHWEVPEALSNPHAKKKLLNMVSFTCKAFNIDELIVVSQQEIQLSDLEINFQVAPTLKNALELVGGTLVYLEEGGESLEAFDHPEDAVYILGSNYGELRGVDAVTIGSSIPLHAEVALGIVLNNRVNG